MGRISLQMLTSKIQMKERKIKLERLKSNRNLGLQKLLMVYKRFHLLAQQQSK